MNGHSVVPSAELNGITFWPVPQFDAVTAAFGADLKSFFRRNDLPKVPPRFEEIASGLFFNGGALPKLAPCVDTKAATVAIKAWLGSFAPAHEAKIATVAYALWVWMTPEAMVKP